MSMINSEPTKAYPESVTVISYDVRRKGHAAWMQDIKTFAEARKECDYANASVQRGHVVIAVLSNGGRRVCYRCV